MFAQPQNTVGQSRGHVTLTIALSKEGRDCHACLLVFWTLGDRVSKNKSALTLYLVSIVFFFFFGVFFRAAPTAYGGSQARGPIGAMAAGLHHSHSNARSLAHWAKPGVEPSTSWLLVIFVSAAPQWELQYFVSFLTLSSLVILLELQILPVTK